MTFNGVPTVGALFFTTGSGRHYCTASVVDSDTEDLVITAAHCVYGSGYATHLEFVPGYQDGREPYGAWAVQGDRRGQRLAAVGTIPTSTSRSCLWPLSSADGGSSA